MFLGRPRPFHVESYGYRTGANTTQLDQTVFFQGRPPQTRRWVITATGPDRFTATLSDAAGTVTGHADGDWLYLRYRYKGPFVVHQTLVRRPDGVTTDNAGTVTLLGVPVGRLREAIAHKD